MQKINQLSKQLQEKTQKFIDLEAESYKLRANYEKMEREFKRVSEGAAENAEEIERLKKLERTLKKDRSVERFTDLRIKSDSTTTLVAASSDQSRLL
jgi:chromosome segregation ATPase